MTGVLLYLLLFIASVLVTLGGCALFTNAIEWLGKRMKVPEGAVGSIFAAIGTTLPETSIPVIAIFFGTGQERVDVGLGAILGAPFMLGTLVLPILAGLVIVYAGMGKRKPAFTLNYGEVRTDLSYFLMAYGLALACTAVPYKPLHYAVAAGLMVLYGRYMRIKFAGETNGENSVSPLFLMPRARKPGYPVIAIQAGMGLVGLVAGAHLFVTAAKSAAMELEVSPLILALLIAPLATELPEMSNSFFWLYKRKDGLAVGNVTGAMVFQGTFPVAVGLFGTDWRLEAPALATMGLALVAAGTSLGQLLWSGFWRPWLLGSGALLYVGYTIYLYVGRS